MKVILENVQIGIRTTGVAKIMNGALNVNNVPFNVGSRGELDNFVTILLANQAEFAGVGNGEYTPQVKEEVQPDPVYVAKMKLDNAYELLQKEVITKEQYLAVVAEFNAVADIKPVDVITK